MDHIHKMRQLGFTLVELLLSLGLSIFILTGMYVLFSSQYESYLAQQAVIQVQENARVAVNLLRDRLRQAGGLGCAAWTLEFPVNLQAQRLAEWLPLHASDVIQGYFGGVHAWMPALPAYLANKVRANTDVLIVHHAHEESVNLKENMSNSTAAFLVSDHIDIKVGDALIIADCEQADIIQVSSLAHEHHQWRVSHQPPYNSRSSLSKAYTQDAQISLLKNVAYYIGDTQRTYADDSPVYALYQFDGQHQELIEGVNRLKVQYGVDTNLDDSVDAFLTLPPQPGQGILRSVMLTLETQSSTPITYRKNSKRYYNEEWFLTVAIRNIE